MIEFVLSVSRDCMGLTVFVGCLGSVSVVAGKAEVECYLGPILPFSYHGGKKAGSSIPTMAESKAICSPTQSLRC